MPGKYSHSVILADYSSRGIISLPPDQFSKYLESAPLTHKSSVTQLRLRGTQSAQAVRRGSPNRGNIGSSQSDQRHVIVGNPPVPPKDRSDLDADANHNDTNQFNPMRYSRYYEQLPKSSPVMGVTSQVSQPELSTAYKRQQQVSSNVGTLPMSRNASNQTRQVRKDVREGDDQRVSAMHDAKVDDNSGQNSATTPRLQSNQALSVDTKTAEDRAASEVQGRDRLSRVDTRVPAVVTPRETDSPIITTTSLERSRPVDVEKQDRSFQSSESYLSSNHVLNKTRPAESQSAQRDATLASSKVSPAMPFLEEPDFDGFSDMDLSPVGYFDSYPIPTVHHHQTSSMNATLPVQRARSPQRPVSWGQRPNGTEVASSALAVVIQNGDVNSPSRTTESSVKTSTRAQRSDSSASSVSVANSHVNLGVPKHSFEGSKKVNQGVLKSDQQWRLPEISEDHGFSPSIFEDNEGHSDNLGLNEPDYRSTIGQISSGKDVLFDNSDAMSELSAALPPPITRFRDEEDEFNANMARLFGEGGDYTVSKKANQSIGRSAGKKTKGFFSKFLSKSSPPVKLREG